MGTPRFHLAALAGALVASAALAPSARAQSPTLELKIQKVQYAVGEPFALELVITAPANSPVSSVDIAGLTNLDVQAGPDVAMSLQVDMRRGVSVAIHSYRYQLAPRQAGSFMLGPATARIGSAVMRSNAVAIKAVPASQSSQQLDADPQMYLQASADKTSVYAGEQVTVSYNLYSRINYFGLELRREPKTDGFWLEELEVPRGYAAYSQQVVNGQPYRVQLLKRQALFPLRTGRLEVGSMILDAQVGSGFFGGGQKLNRASKPLVLEVKPLPAQGRPAGFAEPNVGRYTLSGGVDRQLVGMGEAVKYRVHLEGTGNIKNVILPDLPQGQGYRRFDPEPKVSTRVDSGVVVGARTLEYLLSPSEPGRLVIPALTFHYFDPADAQYKAQTIPETVVTVTGAVAGAPNQAGAQPAQGPLPGADPDLRDIRAEVSAAEGAPFHRGGVFWGLVFAPPVLFVLLLALTRARALRSELRQKGEPRRRAASAYKRLREAERLLSGGDANGFFTEIARVLGAFLELKLGQPIGSLTLPDLERTLAARGYPPELASAVVRELENCDFGRFAPSDARQAEMQGALARTRGLLDGLEKVKPLVARAESETEVSR